MNEVTTTTDGTTAVRTATIRCHSATAAKDDVGVALERLIAQATEELCGNVPLDQLDEVAVEVSHTVTAVDLHGGPRAAMQPHLLVTVVATARSTP